MTIINCDMDGVLVDMDRFIQEELSKKARSDDATMWTELEQIPNVYRMMQPTPYAKRLWTAIASTGLRRRLLTAIPRVTSIPSAETDKRAWVQAHKDSVFNGEQPEVVVGPYSRDKWKHCNPGDILIDDREDNCAQWETAGGIAIYHNGNVVSTIAKLRAAI